MTRLGSWKLVDTLPGEHLVEDTIRQLFDGDGTIYLVTGFFTGNAYRSLRDDIVGFLERSPDNELVILANPSADQFSKTVINDLRKIEQGDRLKLLKYPHGFLHAKLYVRDGPEPMAILGSANLTRGAFEYNLELGMVVEGDGPGDPTISRFVEWIEKVMSYSRPIDRRDLFFLKRVAMTVTNWVNKGRLLPAKHIATRLSPILLVLLGALVLSWIV